MNREELNKLLNDLYDKEVFLKIKDNVDLKVLENYGFKYYKDEEDSNWCFWYYRPRLDCDVTIYEKDVTSPYDGRLIHPKRIVLLNPLAGYCEDREKQEKSFKRICKRLINADLVEVISNETYYYYFQEYR